MNMKIILGLVLALSSFCEGEETNCSGYRCEELLAKVDKLECRLEYTRELLEDKEKTRVPPVPTPACAQCPDTWIQYKGSCYLFVAAKNTFSRAESHCLSLGSHLIHIENDLENEFIRSQLTTLKEKEYWIGLTDAGTEGIFKWVDDNSTASFTDWYRGNPNNGGGNENCVHFRDTYNYTWNDQECAVSYSSICETKTTTKRSEEQALMILRPQLIQ
ncbi:perlucin-like protein [Mercenaria mercenaria]|uniref:perlucin-like protein n=1 Tax=Mercenaria mercenaria TaxID=6596 RepID=UPI001E1D4ACC|nr:perlucin-like protein [Mercenaria mercenaria]